MTLQFQVPNLVCSGCVETVTNAIKAVDSNATIQADPKTKLVSVESKASRTAIENAIASVGYPAA